MECMVCSKKFRNGKALGAHMKAHYAILPLPTKTTPTQEQQQQPTSSLLFPDNDDDDYCGIKTTCYHGLRENTKKSLRISDLKFFDVIDEFESTRSHKRPNKNAAAPVFTAKQALIEDKDEADSDFTEEEDVDLCLVMLSRDSWAVKKCEECHMVFKSSQALGTHMSTNFKKIKNLDSVVAHVQQNDVYSFTTRKKIKKNKIKNIAKQEKEVHKCPLCSRVFNSAQALGGHKRWHLLVAKS